MRTIGKCGCGDQCTCRVVEGLGTDVPGSGNADNPYVINVDGSEISGPGIDWQANKFQVRIAPGGGLEFDASGNLRATGGGGGGGGNYPPATVAALETRTSELIGGSLGAGYYAKPQSLLSSYRHGMNLGLDMMNVAVRFLRDGTPVVWQFETVAKTNLDPAPNGGALQDVQNQDLSRWKNTMTTKPGWSMFYDPQLFGAEPSAASLSGWFGFFEPGQYGLTTLAEVLSEFGGKIVLNLHLTFPMLNAQGEFVAFTPSWRTDLFLGRVRDMIQQHGLQNSVIVSSYALSIPSGVAPPRINVLDWFASAGIRVGAQLDSSADTQTVPAATYPNNWTWVFMSASIPKATIQPYVDKGLNVIIYGVSRRYLRDELVRLPNGVGAKGVLSADPEYYGESKFGNRHRDTVPRLYFQTVKPGFLPAGPDTIEAASPGTRGSFRFAGTGSAWNRLYLDGTEMKDPTDPRVISKWAAFGSFNPNPAPTSFGFDVGLGFDWNSQLDYRWVMFAFCIPTDHSFRDRWEESGQPQFPPDPVNFPLDSGYALLYDSNGFVFLEGWQQGSRTEMAGAQSAPISANTTKHFRVGVNANGIRVSNCTFTPDTTNGDATATIGTYTQGSTIFDVKTDLAKAFRGKYFFVGRHRANAAGNNGVGGWWGIFDQPQLLTNGAAPIGPPA